MGNELQYRPFSETFLSVLLSIHCSKRHLLSKTVNEFCLIAIACLLKQDRYSANFRYNPV